MEESLAQAIALVLCRVIDYHAVRTHAEMRDYPDEASRVAEARRLVDAQDNVIAAIEALPGLV